MLLHGAGLLRAWASLGIRASSGLVSSHQLSISVLYTRSILPKSFLSWITGVIGDISRTHFSTGGGAEITSWSVLISAYTLIRAAMLRDGTGARVRRASVEVLHFVCIPSCWGIQELHDLFHASFVRSWYVFTNHA